MKSSLDSPVHAALIGGVIGAVILVGWLVGSGIDGLGFASMLARVVHVLAAVLWVGMIWFVNFVQLGAVAATDDAGRAALMQHVVPRVAAIYRHASHLTLASGIALLVTSGYMLERWVFKSAVYIPPLKFAMLYGAIAGAIVMWVLVHFVIWPSLRIILGEVAGDAEVKLRARARIRLAARINLILALPVTCIMVAVAHG
ncbi:MAG: hypothetical protein ACKVP7_19300 [Hyphomicrobiaceae bacterium]